MRDNSHTQKTMCKLAANENHIMFGGRRFVKLRVFRNKGKKKTKSVEHVRTSWTEEMNLFSLKWDIRWTRITMRESNSLQMFFTRFFSLFTAYKRLAVIRQNKYSIGENENFASTKYFVRTWKYIRTRTRRPTWLFSMFRHRLVCDGMFRTSRALTRAHTYGSTPPSQVRPVRTRPNMTT